MLTLDHIRDSLNGVAHRYSNYVTTLQWSIGTLTQVPAHLLPPPQGDEGHQALNRLGKRATSIGPRLYEHIRDGTIGAVNWGGDNQDSIDARLESIDLDDLAEKLFERAAISGLIAGIVSGEGPTLGIRRLGGYVEPITDEYDYDIVKGIAQVTAELERVQGGTSYNIRVFDFETGTVKEWTRVTDPNALRQDVEAVPALMPRIHVLQTGPDGLPVGAFTRALPLFQSEWASQVRGDRVEESTGFPQAVIKGEVHGAEQRGPTQIIEVSEGGDYKYVIPGDLGQIHEHHDRKLTRIQEDLRLPGNMLGGQTPSGEALREAAAKFTQQCQRYAGAIERVMNDLVTDYALALGISEPPRVSLEINRDYERAMHIESIRELYGDGLIPFSVAVREISPYVGTMTNKEVEAFILTREPNGLPAAVES